MSSCADEGPTTTFTATGLLSQRAFDLALRQRLSRPPGRAGAAGAPGVGQGARAWPGSPAAVITCTWQAEARTTGAQQAPEVAAASARACLQGWAQKVSGSFCGQTVTGTGLLFVPAYPLAQETAQALGGLLEATARATGARAGGGGWVLRVIGPLVPGLPGEVQRQLTQAGWPVS